MRSRGARFECLRMRPHDHIVWVFAGSRGFGSLAEPFLAEGAALGEQLMYVVADPVPEMADRLHGLFGPERVQVASIAAGYGSSGIVDAATQRATFAGALAQARAEGYTGIRVAADNTPLVTDEERLESWLRWEIVADRFMSEQPVTGLCAFDHEKIDVDRLRHLATLHPLSSVDCPTPQYRLFADAGNVHVEGQIDSFTTSQVRAALTILPPDTGVVIDLAIATFFSRVPLADLQRLAETGASITIRGREADLSELAAAGLAGSERILLEQTAHPAAPPPLG